MRFQEKRFACPTCSKVVTVEYLAVGNGRSLEVSTPCPYCSISIATSIPNGTLIFCATRAPSAKKSVRVPVARGGAAGRERMDD